MQIEVKKEGKVKTYRFIKSWNDVTLEKWIKLIDLRNKTKTKEAEETIRILSDIPKKLIKELKIKDIAAIMQKVNEMQEVKGKLKKIITLNNVEYGMHPNLEDMTLGEWADIEHFIKEGFYKYMPEIMAVLFRPVLEKKNKAYTIPAYDGNINIRAEEFKKMKAIDVQSSLVFFYHLGKKLSNVLPLYLVKEASNLKKKMELNKSTSQVNGGTLD